jgi:transposase
LFPKVNKKTYKFARYLKLSVKAQRRLDAIEIYQKSENIKVKEIADVYKIHPSTFYRWLKRYNPKRIESFEDRSRSPKNPSKPTARIPEYVRSPKMNCYVEKVIDTVQLEWGYKLEDLEEIEEVNKELNKFLIYYNFSRQLTNERKKIIFL